MDVLQSHIVKVSTQQTGIVEAHVHLVIRATPDCEPQRKNLDRHGTSKSTKPRRKDSSRGCTHS